MGTIIAILKKIKTYMVVRYTSIYTYLKHKNPFLSKKKMLKKIRFEVKSLPEVLMVECFLVCLSECEIAL